MATIKKKPIKKAQNGDTQISKFVPLQDKGQYDKTVSKPTVRSTEGDKKISKFKTEFTKNGFPAGERNTRRMENPNAKVNDTLFSLKSKTNIADKTFSGKTGKTKYSIRRPGGVETVESSTAQLGGIPNTVSKKTFTKNKNGGLVKAQNGYQTSPFQKAKQAKEKKKVEYKKFTSTKMKNGGSVAAGTKKPAKRVGPVDPKGAYTTVQKRTLAGAKGKASLTKDKQLGATKMAKSGAKISKKK